MNKKHQQHTCILFSFVLLDESKTERFNGYDYFFSNVEKDMLIKGNNYYDNSCFI